MNIKKYSLILILFVPLTVLADRQNLKFEAFASQLNLTSEQRATLATVFDQREQQVQALKQEPNKLHRKLATLALIAQADSDVEKVLTPEQMQKFNALKQQKLEKLKQKFH